MARSSAEGPPDGFDHDLRDLIDDQRRRDAADRRRREHWLALEAGEAGTFAGVLLDLGEQARPVSIATRSGRRLTGTIRTLGIDFIGLRSPSGQGALLARSAITAVRPEPGTPPSAGDRLLELRSTLRDLLATLAAERPWVSVHTTTGEGQAGILHAVGTDVVTLVRPAERSATHLPLDAVSEVVLP